MEEPTESMVQAVLTVKERDRERLRKHKLRPEKNDRAKMRRRGQKITGNRDLVDHRQHRSSVRCMFRVQQKRVCSFLLMIQLPPRAGTQIPLSFGTW